MDGSKIRINLAVMMAKRNMLLKDLAEKVGITMADRISSTLKLMDDSGIIESNVSLGVMKRFKRISWKKSNNVTARIDTPIHRSLFPFSGSKGCPFPTDRTI